MGDSVADLGEFGLIDLIARGVPTGPGVQLGIGDDAAVLETAGRRIVCSVDTMVENVHFRRDWSSGLETGRKALAAAGADLEAMGADPLACVVALTAPADLPVTWLRFFRQGLLEESERSGLSLVGGDTTAGPVLVVSVTVLGTLDGAPVTRAGARPEDLVAVHGRLGWAAAGLRVLSRGFRSPRAAVAAQLSPEVAWGQGRVAREAGASAMIDVSDGLLADLSHLAEASGVAIDIDPDALEVPEVLRTVAAATGGDPLDLVLGGGEDHALVATFAPDAVPVGWRVIGRVRAGDPEVLVAGAGWTGERGHEHFR